MSGIVIPVSAMLVAVVILSIHRVESWSRPTYDDLAHPMRGNIEHGTLIFARECRMQWVYLEFTI